MSDDVKNEKNAVIKIETFKEKIFKYYKENTFKLFIYAICLTFLISFNQISNNIIYIIITFLLLMGIEYEDYKNIKPKSNCFSLIIGIILIFFGFFLDSILNLVSGMNNDPNFGSTDLIPLLFGIILIFYGIYNLKKFIMPLGISISFLGITYFTTTSIGETLHDSFTSITVSSTVGLLNVLGFSAESVGKKIFLISSKYGVDNVVVEKGCSGFESTIYFTIIGSFLLLKINTKTWKKILIIIIGAIGCFVVNIYRVTILCLVYFWKGMDMVETFHSNLGNLMFIIWIGVLWWIAFKFLIKEENSDNKPE